MFGRRLRVRSPRIAGPLESAKELASRLGPRRLAGLAGVVPSTATLQQILDEFGLVHGIDEDGDLVVRWSNCNIFFFHYGERGEVLQARVYLNTRFDVDLRPGLAVLLDDWNRTKLFPKAYTVLPDDGMVAICAEHAFDFEAGATRELVKYTVGSWIQSLLQFADWLAEQV